MRKVLCVLCVLTGTTTAVAQTSSDSAAAIAQARADLQHLQGEIPRAMMEVRRLTDQAAVDKATLEAQVEALRNVPPPSLVQPMVPPPAVGEK
jgi:hypothetical protein